MIPQKLGKDAKAIIYLETDTKPNKEDDAEGKYSEKNDTRNKRKIVTLNLAGKEWTANQPVNYIIEDNLYNDDDQVKYIFSGSSKSKDITLTGKKRYLKKSGELVKPNTKEERKKAKEYYTQKDKKSIAPGVFKFTDFKSFAAGLCVKDGPKIENYVFPTKQTWEITECKWICDGGKEKNSPTKPDWLKCEYTEGKNITSGGILTFTTDPDKCPEKLIRIDVTLKQAGSGKELKLTMGFLLPFPYTEADIKLPIPVADVKNENLK